MLSVEAQSKHPERGVVYNSWRSSCVKKCKRSTAKLHDEGPHRKLDSDMYTSILALSSRGQDKPNNSCPVTPVCLMKPPNDTTETNIGLAR